MNRRIALIGAAFLLLFAAVLGYQKFAGRPALTISLRCAENVSGKLSVAVAPDGKKEIFDVADACRTGKISVSGYEREADAQLTFESKTGERRDLLSKYGANIQSDPNGFNMILKITGEPPFIFNENL